MLCIFFTKIQRPSVWKRRFILPSVRPQKQAAAVSARARAVLPTRPRSPCGKAWGSRTPRPRGLAQASVGAAIAPFHPASPQAARHPAWPLCRSLYPLYPLDIKQGFGCVFKTYNMERDVSPALPLFPGYLSQLALPPFHVKVDSGTKPEGNKDYNYTSQLGKEES